MTPPASPSPIRCVILGLSITSAWGNGHATTYRSLVRELARRGHEVHFLERDMPWYARHRDLPDPPFGVTHLYQSLGELKKKYRDLVRNADLVIVGSYVPEGIRVGKWVIRVARGVTAFYDIDTPVTLDRLKAEKAEYISRKLVPRYDLYLSFTGGPILDRLHREFGARQPRALYCSVDPTIYYPQPTALRWDLGYLGTYSDDRQPTVDALLVEPARRLPDRRFIVAGALYPASIAWPSNVELVEHIPPGGHRAFYTAQRFTLNVTRAEMIRAGYSPSVRLFEAAACGVPIVSDWWEGLDMFFEPGREILIARTAAESLACLRDYPEKERVALGQRARERVLRSHTAAHRAAELELHFRSVTGGAAVVPAIARTVELRAGAGSP